jgi:hypothetical protein
MAVVSLLVAAYAGVQSFATSMAGSSLVGVASRTADQRHFGYLSWFWLALATLALVVFVASISAIICDRSTRRDRS